MKNNKKHGGKRQGAGRPKTEKKMVTITTRIEERFLERIKADAKLTNSTPATVTRAIINNYYQCRLKSH